LTLTLLLIAAFCAGFIDAIAGGGGLLQFPALMQCLPGVSLSQVSGTNKGSSVFGTLAAIPQYARHVRFDAKFLWCTLPAAFACSYGGAFFFDHLDTGERSKTVLRPLILGLLIAVAIYTYWKKDLGNAHREQPLGGGHYAFAAGVGAAIGFYDGFFGPGTGSFLIFVLIRYLRFNFLYSTAYAKCINAATNFGALAYFIPHDKVLFATALPMAGANILGGTLGARTAILRGNKFVRILFLLMIAAVITRLGWDVLQQWHRS
jgi:uncharacterized membrane protein YfcA